ncbi:MAG: hypothetical protein ACRD88_10100, partial [Terriglobia bacterium]
MTLENLRPRFRNRSSGLLAVVGLLSVLAGLALWSRVRSQWTADDPAELGRGDSGRSRLVSITPLP